ncbi:unnamed protein product [Moneuplotes crassus]|uniref:CCHC-type domain-containing protein n=1 Tax=Euplotes crassus TaxID=5936 RepID=A0AAD1Y615_EUPCR|nr:unnamed protein product [Moneuplotes crassus]
MRRAASGKRKMGQRHQRNNLFPNEEHNSQRYSAKRKDVDPLLAAKVVKEYLLPMFNKRKPITDKNKRNEISQLLSSEQIDDETFLKAQKEVPKTVFGQLVLSDMLYDKIQNMQIEDSEKKEILQQIQQQRDDSLHECFKLKSHNKLILARNKLLEKENAALKRKIRNLEFDIKSIQKKLNDYISLSDISESERVIYRRKFRDAKVSSDRQKNQIIKLTEEARLRQLDQEVLRNQLKNLYKAVNNLSGKGSDDEQSSNSKCDEDKFIFQLKEEKKKTEEIIDEKKVLEYTINDLLEERDGLRIDLKDMAKARMNLLQDHKVYGQRINQEMHELKDKYKKATETLNIKEEELVTLNLSMKGVTSERDKLKEKIQKLKNKRQRVDINQKMCKKCNKDFLESENYNWSCRTHTSEFTVMYWCCGKSNKDAPGCTVGKHESRDDEDDPTAEDKEEKHKYAQCLCCKETGHTMGDCPKDPNYKFGKDVKDESVRLLHADEISRHPKPDYIGQISKLIKDCAKDRKKDRPFTIGSLKFDDYNYDYINPKILISAAKMIKIHEEGDKYEGKPMKIMFTKEEAESINSGYIKPDEFKDLILNNQNDFEKKQEEENKDNKDDRTEDESGFIADSKVHLTSKSNKYETEQEEEESEDEDERLSTKEFDHDDIIQIYEDQENDPFENILAMKEEAVIHDDDSGNHSRRRLIKGLYQEEDDFYESSKIIEQEGEMSNNSSIMSTNNKIAKVSSFKSKDRRIEEVNKSQAISQSLESFFRNDHDDIEIKRTKKKLSNL